jgi:2-methylcitrate dehydratase PrpD
MDAQPQPEVTLRLGEWVSGLDLPSIPADVVAQLKACVLDSIGCGLFGAAQPWGVIAGDVAVAFSAGGTSSLFARAEKVSATDAALANGTAIHAFEIDDAHVSSSHHPGAVTLPACLAVAEAQDSSGAQMLAALAAGYEVGIRVGICAGVTHSTSGYHVTGTVGTLGAAAAAARLLRLPPGKTAHALGLGATQAAGLYSARTAGMAKRFHAGRAAQSGVIAAYLAEKGFTGSLDALEAPFGGFMSTLHGQSEPGTILADLGERWETARVGLKPYAACASAHTTIDGMRDLKSRGLTAANLERLTIRMSKKGHVNIGWPYQPAEIITAQMNGYYAAAVILIDGEAFIDQYTEDRIADPKILALMPRIEIIHDPDLDRGGAAKRHAVKIDAVLKDGSVLSTYIEQRRGSADHPLSVVEIEQKFSRLAADFLSEVATGELIEIVAQLELQRDMKRLIELITTSRNTCVYRKFDSE